MTKEELIQHLVSYEFGKLLKKYKNTEDLNLSDGDRGDRGSRGERDGRGDRNERGRGRDRDRDRGWRENREDRGDRADRGDRRSRGGGISFSTFSMNVGREDGMTPRDLMALINQHSRHRGVEVGGIQIHDTDTHFEIEEESAHDFFVDFKRVFFNGIPVTLVPIQGRVENRGRDRDHRGNRGERAFAFPGRSDRGKSSRGRWIPREEFAGRRRGKPGSNPKKPRNFSRS